MKSFLIIQTAFIGDVILATSIIEKLHKFHPDAKIDFLLRKGNESLLNNHPYINNLIIWNKKNQKYKNLFHILSLIRKQKYDYVVNLQRFASTGYITSFSKAKNRIGFRNNPFSIFFTKRIKHTIQSGIHEVDRNNCLIKHLTDEQFERPKLHPSVLDFDNVSKYKSSEYICIAPTSVWFTKQFPAKKWIEFINQIQTNLTVYLLGAKSDFAACEEIQTQCKEINIINLAGKISLIESAALIKDAKMTYVNDSAPLHIASAMNSPTAAIFCSTVTNFGFGPLADKSTIIQTHKNLNCRPCGLHGRNKCKTRTFECANSIDIKEMLNLLK
ncbi:MAG: glycosyltransferase family 9 protein [Bacteroidetes bacterium]|nr:glycosyltransferase family 9 protein [Bacteroidota bacterium]